LTGETTVVKEKLVAVLLCPPQIPYGLTQLQPRLLLSHMTTWTTA